MLVSEFATALRPRTAVNTRSRAARSGGADLGDEIPAAVGRVDAADLGNPAEGGDDGAGVGGADLDRHDGADPGGAGVAAEAQGEAEDDAARDEPVDAVLDRAARDPEAARKGGAGEPCVVAQVGDKLAVGVVEGGHLAKGDHSLSIRQSLAESPAQCHLFVSLPPR